VAHDQFDYDDMWFLFEVAELRAETNSPKFALAHFLASHYSVAEFLASPASWTGTPYSRAIFPSMCSHQEHSPVNLKARRSPDGIPVPQRSQCMP
jgi:hypothetical protein